MRIDLLWFQRRQVNMGSKRVGFKVRARQVLPSATTYEAYWTGKFFLLSANKNIDQLAFVLNGANLFCHLWFVVLLKGREEHFPFSTDVWNIFCPMR